MCGIVGILGSHEVAPLILEALKRLEYRGYDSAGIATLSDGHLDRRRSVGKLVALSDLLVQNPIRGHSGIGHTRWATHGAPSERNAHPHRAGTVAVVHNGIIENFRELRDELAAEGCVFETDTDTEAVVQLCDRELRAGKTPLEAARATLAQLEGAFALAFLFEGEEDLLIAARRGSPLAVGHGDGEAFIGSDALALAPLTNRVTYLEEGDHAVLTRDSIAIFDAAGQPVRREIVEVPIENFFAEKGPYKHFMAKEMHEQPTVISDALARYVSDGRDRIEIPPGVDFSRCERLVMVACGTAYYACHVAKYWFERLARIPVEIEVASEFRYREPPLGENAIGIFVSQSGETADTLAALRYVRGEGGQIVAVVNVETSTIARESDVALPILAGPEIGVASTKAFTCQLTVLAGLAIAAGRQRGTLDAAEEARLVTVLCGAPGLLARALALEPQIAEIAKDIAKARDILFLGRGTMYPLALEGALKLKEISYIHAEGYASGELKHGPIALIDEDVPVVVLSPSDGLFDKAVSNMQEVMARDGKVVLISDSAGLAAANHGVWHSLQMPACDPFVAPILYAAPAQLLAYHTAVQKGTDVDQPRNLAKSVTVE
ncbi:MAG TPA: glutamine--fructose-6-phosphate transaminase (isomerizing) [Amaricoccus sp.]|uniref:glutamine--fructose-6-phosphate transaminase (isomerizing) n=1 Tax=Amaricoccus sp. TaxID=1872485 RepID=UPI002C2851B6|nr:glutamine--fructose-6-phosphate transaminase (isomerizing) [Amaricoccus sp.]HMQ92392.1 glutamine--fructose-6-phosphate transaminase (isomerizing) [Amaricoccus sp.]HMR51414.1 glutamine--fructose-6-phosphate transaminase (isomerizing) [Amaricoccus sp.]HMR60606.1 glutamine--fructose-6-phosphate transaminase (isomerizing) [Amaricoccus sp.]HMT98303.1 glutamine--fructose-6-phosphate transaminase (isomerizing) [Amaricoccus sp.]